MSRAERRALNRRADRAFARARGTMLEADLGGGDWVMLTEHDGRVVRVPARHVPGVLATLGLDDYFAIVEGDRAAHGPAWIPVLVVVGSSATIRWGEALLMVRGGAA